MKKHIQKKFLTEYKVEDEHIKKLKDTSTYLPYSDKSKVKIKKGQLCFLETESGFMLGAFPYNNSGKEVYIPNPIRF